MRGLFSLPALAAVLAAGPGLAAPAPMPPTVSPLRTQGAVPVYPRIVRFDDAKTAAHVNMLLAAQEKVDRSGQADCYRQLKTMGQAPTKDSYLETVRVAYVSARFLSLDVTTSYDCGGAYPTSGAESPITFDLKSGLAIDWPSLFKPGFMPSDTGGDNAKPSALTRLYRARYPKDQDADCKSAITDQDPFEDPPAFWLDAKRGLMAQPDFPHVIAACAEPLALSAADIAPYLKDPALAADLKAKIGR